jgi:hypothetical protein
MYARLRQPQHGELSGILDDLGSFAGKVAGALSSVGVAVHDVSGIAGVIKSGGMLTLQTSTGTVSFDTKDPNFLNQLRQATAAFKGGGATAMAPFAGTMPGWLLPSLAVGAGALLLARR